MPRTKDKHTTEQRKEASRANVAVARSEMAKLIKMAKSRQKELVLSDSDDEADDIRADESPAVEIKEDPLSVVRAEMDTLKAELKELRSQKPGNPHELKEIIGNYQSEIAELKKMIQERPKSVDKKELDSLRRKMLLKF